MNAWALAFGVAWGVSWGSGDAPPGPVVVPAAIDHGSGSMGGIAGPIQQYVEHDLANEDEEMELAHIAALVIRMMA